MLACQAGCLVSANQTRGLVGCKVWGRWRHVQSIRRSRIEARSMFWQPGNAYCSVGVSGFQLNRVRRTEPLMARGLPGALSAAKVAVQGRFPEAMPWVPLRASNPGPPIWSRAYLGYWLSVSDGMARHSARRLGQTSRGAGGAIPVRPMSGVSFASEWPGKIIFGAGRPECLRDSENVSGAMT